MLPLIRIGYWRNESEPELPDPHGFVDPEWDEDERDAVRQYFGSGTIARTWMGYSRCRFCGCNNGAYDFSDGRYLWPQGLSHYIEDHAVRLPPSLVDYAMRRLDQLETIETDDTWWNSVALPGSS